MTLYESGSYSPASSGYAKKDKAYGWVDTYTLSNSHANAVRATFVFDGQQVATISPPAPKDGNLIEQINFLKNAVDEFTRGGTICFAAPVISDPLPALYGDTGFGIIDEVASIAGNISTAKAA